MCIQTKNTVLTMKQLGGNMLLWGSPCSSDKEILKIPRNLEKAESCLDP